MTHIERILLGSKPGSKNGKGFVASGKHERTNVRTDATNETNVSKTWAEIVAFLNVRVGLWITRISRNGRGQR